MNYAGADTQEWPKGERVLTEEQIMELIASGDQPAYAEAVRRHEQVAAVFSQLTAEQRQRALRFMSERRNPSNAMETMRQGG